jgi:dTDP-3-amino-3,4,6-trideoxy-alpha-D-glucose transaminase
VANHIPEIRIPILDLKAAVEELRPQLDEAYRRVMNSGWFLLGKELQSFEEEYAQSIGVRHCVGVANGLEAMQLVLMALGVGPGDEVIVPSNGYIATWLAVTHVGARPIPCEPDHRTYNLDTERLARVVTPRTKMILPIHLYGQPADIDAIAEFANKRGLFVLEDAAQSHGARCNGRQAGALGDAAGISFYPSKNLGALADGGAVTTDNDALADKLRYLRNYGSKERYQNDHLGLNSRLSELQAAFLRVKLPHLGDWNRRRAVLAAHYHEQLGGISGLTLPFVPDWAEPAWHLYVVRTSQRDRLKEHLTTAGIGTQVHYPTPPHLSKAYASGGWKPNDFPIAEQLAKEVLSLPLSPHHTVAQIDTVCAAIRDFYRHG